MMHTISSQCFLFLHLSLYLHCKTMKAWNCSLARGPWFEPLHHLLLPTMIICSKTGSCSLLKDVLVFLKFSQRRAQTISTSSAWKFQEKLINLWVIFLQNSQKFGLILIHKMSRTMYFPYFLLCLFAFDKEGRIKTFRRKGWQIYETINIMNISDSHKK